MTRLEILNNSRIEDLKILKRFRGKKGYFWSQEEIRNILFVYANCLSHKDIDVAISEFLDFANGFDNRSKNFLKSILARIPKFCRHYAYVGSCRYKFSNKKIIDMLSITKEEQEYLSSIIDEDIMRKKDDFYLEAELEKIRIENQIDESIKQNEIENIFRTYRDPVMFDENSEIQEDEA